MDLTNALIDPITGLVDLTNALIDLVTRLVDLTNALIDPITGLVDLITAIDDANTCNYLIAEANATKSKEYVQAIAGNR